MLEIGELDLRRLHWVDIWNRVARFIEGALKAKKVDLGLY